MTLKIYIKTYGCQMNERDSEAAAAALINAGYTMTDSEKEADILLFNTCSVRDQAERKAIGKIGIIKKLKKKNPEIIIGVLGCMAQSKKDEIIEQLPHVDFVLGTDQLFSLVSVIESELKSREKIVRTQVSDTLESLESMGGHLRYSNSDANYAKKHSEDSCSAFISLMRGCNRFCSYCIVPYVRGREKSREVSSIIKEAKQLVDSGIKEVMLLGQNVAAYGFKPGQEKESPFADLLEHLNNITGLERIRFISPHPSCFNDSLIDAVATLPKVCNNIHLPIQSGSEKILKLMRRGYTPREYLKIVEKLKQKTPDITFSTDIIIGFPGEETDDFNATRTLMENVGFDNAFIFKYSPRRGTKAAEMEDSVPISIKEERNAILLADLKARTSAHNSLLEGKALEILVEGVSKRNTERWFGRTMTNKVVVFEPYPEILKGDIVNIMIEKSTSMTLFGKKS
jgi:tRNA-2-methylthio-N6-dimethylallyladenosine synthase